MEKEYWKQFTSTGSVEDYLSYRMEAIHNASGLGDQETSMSLRLERTGPRSHEQGVGNCESDCTDRDRTVYGSGWRI